MLRKISIFHSTAGYLGSWTEQTTTPAGYIYSLATFCSICGDVWCRRVQEIDGATSRWTYVSGNCQLHDGGQVLMGGDATDFTTMTNIAQGVLVYEFLNELTRLEARNRKKEPV